MVTPVDPSRRGSPLKHRGYPDDVDAQVLQIVHLADDTGDIPQAISIAILEASWIYLTVSEHDCAIESASCFEFKIRRVIGAWVAEDGPKDRSRQTHYATPSFHQSFSPVIFAVMFPCVAFETMADYGTQIFGETITISPGCWIYKATSQCRRSL